MYEVRSANTYIYYSIYIEYALRRRALNATKATKSWPHKYPFDHGANLVQVFHSECSEVPKTDCTITKIKNVKLYKKCFLSLMEAT